MGFPQGYSHSQTCVTKQQSKSKSNQATIERQKNTNLLELLHDSVYHTDTCIYISWLMSSFLWNGPRKQPSFKMLSHAVFSGITRQCVQVWVNQSPLRCKHGYFCMSRCRNSQLLVASGLRLVRRFSSKRPAVLNTRWIHRLMTRQICMLRTRHAKMQSTAHCAVDAGAPWTAEITSKCARLNLDTCGRAPPPVFLTRQQRHSGLCDKSLIVNYWIILLRGFGSSEGNSIRTNSEQLRIFTRMKFFKNKIITVTYP